jgi:hypothetical protein
MNELIFIHLTSKLTIHLMAKDNLSVIEIFSSSKHICHHSIELKKNEIDYM